MPATVAVVNWASFPSPEQSVWNVGPIPIRAYALCIIAGIVAAIWIGERRWVARGGRRGTVSDVAVWAVVFGLVGGRLYHVITDNELYFRAGRDPWRAFAVWEGGLGIWGAIALGGVGAWIGCRRAGIALPPFADAVAPGIAVAQGIGRWGNYFNQELFGRPTDLPWAVRIDPDQPNAVAGATTYHPAFLYESIWDFALAGVLVLVDRRFRLGHGRVFALYVVGYTAGRVWIEMLRIDTANHILGLRLNVWTSIVVFAGGLAYFLLVRGPRETEVEPRARADAADGAAAGAGGADDRPETAETDKATGTDEVAEGDGAGEAAAPVGEDAGPGTTGARDRDAGTGTAGDRATGPAADRPAGPGTEAGTADPDADSDPDSDPDADSDPDSDPDADPGTDAGTGAAARRAARRR